MSPLPGGYKKTATYVDQQLAAQLVHRAQNVSRLMAKRRKVRKKLREIESEIRKEKKFLRDLAER